MVLSSVHFCIIVLRRANITQSELSALVMSQCSRYGEPSTLRALIPFLLTAPPYLPLQPIVLHGVDPAAAYALRRYGRHGTQRRYTLAKQYCVLVQRIEKTIRLVVLRSHLRGDA